MAAIGDAVERLDHAVGDRLERFVRNHHRRRLELLGHARALEPPGSDPRRGGPPPRAGNAFDVPIDGDHALPAIAKALRALAPAFTSPPGT